MGTSLQSAVGSPYEYDLVVLRSRDKQSLFRDDRQRAQFLDLIHRAQRRTGICILAYVLLESEVHFIVQTIRGSLARSRFVQRLKSQYSRRVHKAGNGETDAAHDPKHLFQRRYHCDSLAVSAVPQAIGQLHQLPVQHGLIQDQNRFAWSSRRGYLRQVELPWLSVDWALELDKLPNFPFPLPMSTAAGKQFVAWLAEAVTRKIGLPTAELYSRKRSRKVTMVRGIVAYHAMRWGVTLRCVARYLRPKSSSTLASSTLTAAIDRYEPQRPELFDMDIHELLAELPEWRRTNALLSQGSDSRSD